MSRHPAYRLTPSAPNRTSSPRVHPVTSILVYLGIVAAAAYAALYVVGSYMVGAA